MTSLTANPFPLSLYTGTKPRQTAFTRAQVEQCIMDLAADGDPLADMLRYMAQATWGGPAADGY